MRIERIELAGFKSFADPVVLEFQGGSTAIVGPNGCGKSNIADAVFWALGELGASTIRARGKDLIFSGSGLREPLGVAEVRMHLSGAPEDLGGLNRPRGLAGRPKTAVDAADAAPEEPAPDREAPAGTNGAAPSGPEDASETEDASGTGRSVTVSRRVDRTGTSTYRIDGRRARRRDVQRLFAAAGLGPGSYALIEQGRANDVITRRPEELRVLVEEAAGLGSYRLNRQESEANLRAAEKALERVRDRLAELDRAIRQAKRDARSAKRARKTGERIRLLRVAEQAARRAALSARIRQGRAPEVALADERDRRALSLGAFDRFLAGLRAERAELAESLRDATRRLGDARGEQARAEAVLTEGEHAAAGRAARLPRLAEEEREVEARREARREEHSRLAGRAGTFPDLLERLSAETAARAEGRDRLRREEREVESAAAAARHDRQRLEASATAKRLAGQHHDRQRERLSAARLELAGSTRELEARAVSAAKRAEDAAAEEERQAGEVAGRREAAEAADRALERAAAERANARRQEAEARAALEGARARLASVRALVLSREQLGPTAARLLRLAPERGLPVLGAVGDAVEVDTGFESAAERLLGVHRVRVEKAEDLFPLLDSLDADEAAPCEALVAEFARACEPAAESDAAAADGPAEAAPEKTQPDETRLGAHVRAEAPEVRAAIPDAVVTPDLRTALARFRERPGLYVTRAGETVAPPGVVRFGRGGPGEGYLAARREAAEREEERERAEAHLVAAEAALEVAVEAASLAETERDARREALARAEAELGRRRLAAERARQDETAVARRREQVRDETAAHAEEEQRNEEAAARSVEELARDREALEETGRRLAEAETRLAEVRRRLDAAERAWEEADRELARQTAVADEVRREESSRERQAADDSRRLARIGEERDALRAEDEEWKARREAALRGRRDAAARSREWQAEEARLTEAGDRHSARLAQAEDALRARRAELDSVERRLTAARSEVGEAKTLLADLEAEFERTAGRPLADAAAGLPADLAGRERDEIAGELREQEDRLARLGPVNEIAEARLRELLAERDGPAAHLRDVEQGIGDGLEALERHDRDARRRFHRAFEAVDAGFDVAFRQLFGGGRAELRLTTPEPAAGDPAIGEGEAPPEPGAGSVNGNGAAAGDAAEPPPEFRPGVEMRAQPPGKKLQSLRLLSGGEKALTAIAFLIALFRYRPAPFCLLDEVDAPLDDANVQRFAGLLDELKQDTQLVVITHNRQTMESCEHLYGVTMEEPGVSRLVSVEIGDEQIEGWLGDRGDAAAAERALGPPAPPPA